MAAYKTLRALKGGSLSSTTVIQLPDGETRVRKFISRSENREYGLVRWQSQVRRMQHLHTILPDNAPAILEMGIDGPNFYYDIPFYKNSQNLFEYLSERGNAEAVDLFNKVLNIINIYTETEYGDVVGSFSVFFAEEVSDRLKRASSQLDGAFQSGFISNEELSYIKAEIEISVPKVDKVIFDASLLTIEETFTHGNFTLENALYQHESKKIILIDPYSETYTESVLGDYSQLLQSSVSLYETVVAKGEGAIGPFFERPADLVRTGVNDFGDCLTEYLSTFDDDKKKIINLFHAAQFVRMFPFKIEKTPRLAIYFLLHGLSIIKGIKLDA